MATRSYIAIRNSDGTVSGVYCHWDGYPEGVGKTLTTHYNTPELVEELLKLGSLSSLGSTITDPETVAYHRDRGEPMESDSSYKNHTDMILFARRELGVEWAYVWNGNSWETCDL